MNIQKRNSKALVTPLKLALEKYELQNVFLAQELNCHPSNITRCANGMAKPSLELAEQMTVFFNQYGSQLNELDFLYPERFDTKKQSDLDRI